MSEEKQKLAVFIDFDNIQIGVQETLGKEFDVALVLEALKERGEVVTKVAYGDWPRAGEQSRQMTQHAVQMVQRNVTPRGDKNGADINLALDALEMAFNRPHINAFAIVGGDSDFIALVEKLKQYDKRVYVVGGRAFTSNILQKNCYEFIAYENLLRSGSGGDGGRTTRSARRAALEPRPLSESLANVQRALKILSDREVTPQLGLVKSTILQLDSTFSERDYGASSFLEFMQKMEKTGLVHLRRIERGYLVDSVEGEGERAAPAGASTGVQAASVDRGPATSESPQPAIAPASPGTGAEAMGVLKQAVAAASAKAPHRPLYVRHIRQGLRTVDKGFDERNFGFRGILDLLHQAQREGWLILQRDRKGVVRIFPTAVTASAPAISPGSVEQAAEPPSALPAEPSEVETTPGAEEAFVPAEAVPAEAAVPEVSSTLIEEAAVQETRAAPTNRKRRPARGSGSSSHRKPSARRKPKTPSSSGE